MSFYANWSVTCFHSLKVFLLVFFKKGKLLSKNDCADYLVKLEQKAWL